jgi:hypothetical protein
MRELAISHSLILCCNPELQNAQYRFVQAAGNLESQVGFDYCPSPIPIAFAI